MASVQARSRYIGMLALACALVACTETPGHRQALHGFGERGDRAVQGPALSGLRTSP